MKNTDLKANLLTTGKYDEYKKAKREYYKNGDITGLNDFNYDELKSCYQLSDSRKKQRQKIENHIKFLFETNLDLFFVTLTFTNKILAKTTKETRKRYVINALSNCDDYIVNIDFGDETERVHYHAVIGIQKNKYELRKNEFKKIKLSIFDEYENKVGNTDIKRISQNDKSAKKISNYIAKLTLHSLKVKQTYVSVKKGSNYQLFQKAIKKQKLLARYEDLRKINEFWTLLEKDIELKFY